MSTSLSLGPPTKSSFRLFLNSQLVAKPQYPPKDTDLSGKVAIITGASAGLGLEASRQFLSLNLTTLILAVRNFSKGNLVATHLRAQFPKANIKVWELEMESYESIQKFVERCSDELERLDIAILNAGIQRLRFERVTATGHEKYIQVNYLSTMLLAVLLLPILKAKKAEGKPGRLSIVSESAFPFNQTPASTHPASLPCSRENLTTLPRFRYSSCLNPLHPQQLNHFTAPRRRNTAMKHRHTICTQ